jgi:hypothetical protein
MSDPGPHLGSELKEGLEAPTLWGFFVREGQMRNSSLDVVSEEFSCFGCGEDDGRDSFHLRLGAWCEGRRR